MANIANIVAFDGATPPISHTLIPISVTREKEKVTAIWREQLASVPVYAQISTTMSLERMKSGVYRVESRTVVPVMESISGQNAAGYTAVPKVAYEDTYMSVGFYHERSTIAGRRLVRQLGVNISNGVATTVAPVTTGPLPELFDLLVTPT